MEVYKVQIAYTDEDGKKAHEEFVVPAEGAWDSVAEYLKEEWAEQVPMMLEVHMWWLGEHFNTPPTA